MSKTIERVQQLMKDRIAEIEAEVADLRKAHTGLNGSSAPTAPKRRGSKKRRRLTKRAKKGQRRKEVSALLKANPKAKTSEIAKRIGISSNQVSALRTQLKKKAPSSQKKQAKKTAAKAGTKKAAKKGAQIRLTSKSAK